jgi:hypothetical protein
MPAWFDTLNRFTPPFILICMIVSNGLNYFSFNRDRCEDYSHTFLTNCMGAFYLAFVNRGLPFSQQVVKDEPALTDA